MCVYTVMNFDCILVTEKLFRYLYAAQIYANVHTGTYIEGTLGVSFRRVVQVVLDVLDRQSIQRIRQGHSVGPTQKEFKLEGLNMIS